MQWMRRHAQANNQKYHRFIVLQLAIIVKNQHNPSKYYTTFSYIFMLFCETFCCHLVCYKNTYTHTHTHTHAVGAQNWDVVLCLGWVIKSCSIIRAGFFFIFFFYFFFAFFSATVFAPVKKFFYAFPPLFSYLSAPSQLYGKYLSALRVFCSVCLANSTKSCINDTTPRHAEVQHLLGLLRQGRAGQGKARTLGPRNIKF